MPMISCNMRFGRTDEQKRALSAGLLRVVSEATGEPADNILFVIREGRGINFVEHGKHLPEFVFLGLSCRKRRQLLLGEPMAYRVQMERFKWRI
jgi:phenylpyruvate tautomerase PptA (4-oxalocrotonate tautomerase family)